VRIWLFMLILVAAAYRSQYVHCALLLSNFVGLSMIMLLVMIIWLVEIAQNYVRK